MRRETKSQGSHSATEEQTVDTQVVFVKLCCMLVFHMPSLLMCLVKWILFSAKQPSAQPKYVCSPTGAGESSHVAAVKNHMHVLCWAGVCNTYYSSN